MDQTTVYEEFASFDWAAHPDFKDGLDEILESHLSALKERDPNATAIPAVERLQLVDQAKSFYFCSKTGHILSLDDYREWQKTQSTTQALTQGTNQEVPYSSNYQNVVELIMSGKEVPGIKQIPETVLAEQGSQPEAEARKKPWEK